MRQTALRLTVPAALLLLAITVGAQDTHPTFSVGTATAARGTAAMGALGCVLTGGCPMGRWMFGSPTTICKASPDPEIVSGYSLKRALLLSAADGVFEASVQGAMRAGK